jgi:large repetitive protein
MTEIPERKYNNSNNSNPRADKVNNQNDQHNIEELGRALLRQSARNIRHAGTTKFRRVSAGSLALAIAASQIVPAFATINNTVTASGTAPGNVPVSGNANTTVGVQTAAPGITQVKTAAFAVAADDVNGNGLADPGDKITYIYQVTNSGNVTVKDVGIADAHDGVGIAPVIAVPASVTTDAGSLAAGTLNDSTDAITSDATWGILGPGDVIQFKSTYIVVSGDITGAGGGTGTGLSTLPEPDGYIDNRATASASYTSGVTTTNVTSVSRANKKLNVTNGLQITKVPNLNTNVAAGTTVTYTYTVTNSGNTPISNVVLHDTHNGVLDALTPAFQSFTTNTGSSNTGNTINTLAPGDVAVYTAQYVVTQADVDNRQ